MSIVGRLSTLQIIQRFHCNTLPTFAMFIPFPWQFNRGAQNKAFRIITFLYCVLHNLSSCVCVCVCVRACVRACVRVCVCVCVCVVE